MRSRLGVEYIEMLDEYYTKHTVDFEETFDRQTVSFSHVLLSFSET